jgi:hypothetical protein
MPVMSSVAWMGIVLALLTAQRSPSARELLNAPRAWTTAEGATIVASVQSALTGKTFQLSFVGHSGGPEILMGGAGRPTRIRWRHEGGIVGGVVFGDGTSVSNPVEHHRVIEVDEYTGRAARRCDGSVEAGELVIEYRGNDAGKWSATARQTDAHDFGGPGIAPFFEMLRGIQPVTSGERKRIRGRWALAIIASWIPPPTSSDPAFLTGDPIPNVSGEPMPNAAVQTLWIDTKSLLPLRWEASNRGRVVYAYDFTYRRINLRLPGGIRAPDCIL